MLSVSESSWAYGRNEGVEPADWSLEKIVKLPYSTTPPRVLFHTYPHESLFGKPFYPSEFLLFFINSSAVKDHPSHRYR